MNYEALNNDFFFVCKKVIADKSINAYLVGGWVRDIILDRPSTDIDIVVEGQGIEFANIIAKELNPSPKVNFYSQYGTAHFYWQGINYEWVGARKESYNRESRNPIVEKGTFEEDIARRDFTINTMAISLCKDNYGQLIDLYNGKSDIASKIIRTPLDPDITFSDDPLRMLRAIRFSSQLGFEIESNTLLSIKRQAHRIEIISKERIHTELNKILLSPKPSIGIDLIQTTGLMKYILPELEWLKGVEVNNGKGHKDNYYHTLQVVDNIAPNTRNIWLLWAALLHDIAKPQTKSFDDKNGWSFHGHEVLGSKMAIKIFKNLKLPLDKPLEYVRKLIFLHLRPIALTKEEISDAAVRRLLFEAGDDIEDLITLCRADITSKNEAKVARYITNLDNLIIKIKEVEARDHIKNFQPPVSGEYIMEKYDLKPCRDVGILKNNIKEAILEGKINNNFDEAVQYLDQLVLELKLSNTLHIK